MKKVVVGKDGKPLMASRCVHFDANRPGVNEHDDLIGKDGNTRKAASQVNFENNAAVVNNIAATSHNDALNKNESVIHVSGHNECTYGVLSTDEHDTHATNTNNNNNMRDKPTCVQNDSHGTKEGTDATDAVGNGSKQSFALIFKTQSVSKAMRLTTMASEFVQGANVAIPLAVVEEVSQRFENMLYGYFLGKWLAFPLVETYVKNAWAKFGLERTMLTNGFFFFQFATRESMERVLENGPWLIRLVPIFLNIWTPNIVLKNDTITSAPSWVKLHHVPIVAFSEIGLSLITSQLGRPIMLDAYTSTMCQKSWGRNSYARALVEVSSLAALKESLAVVIPFPNRTGHSLEMVEVEYEWQPPPPGVSHVKRKNGKGKHDGKAKQVAGIHLTKPKPKLVYREVQKTPTNNNDKATTSNTDSSIRKDNQPTMQPEDGINIVSLRNSFESLMEKDKVLDTDDTPTCENILFECGCYYHLDIARIIMDTLEEFKEALRLTPSLPKSTAYFCNVINYIKIDILNILLLEEGKLLVMYFGVHVVPSRLLCRDCKELIEKVKWQISDCENKSLSFAELDQLMRGFLWCQGEMKKGRAKSWPDVWMSKYSDLGTIGVPHLSDASDKLVWKDLSNVDVGFSVATIWECIRPRSDVVWDHLKRLTGIPNIPSGLDAIVDFLSPMAKMRSARSVISKLVFAASWAGLKEECSPIAVLFFPSPRLHGACLSDLCGSSSKLLEPCTISVYMVSKPPAPNPDITQTSHYSSVSWRETRLINRWTDVRNLRFTLRYDNKEYVLDDQIPTIDNDSTQEEFEAHRKHYDHANKVSCIMASSMSRELQMTFENTYEMNQQLKEMFQPKASKERLDVVKSLMDCKPKPEASNCAFVLEIKGYFDILESLNMVFDTELSINIILSGLPADYNQFVLSYQMNTKDTSIMELHSLLQTTKQGIKKIKAAKGKFNRGSKRNDESEIAPTNDPKEAAYFYCNTKGHWKRSCLKYLRDLKDEKVEKGSHSGSKKTADVEAGELTIVMETRKITPVTRKWERRVHVKSGVRKD
ncbi:zinc knuckle CX2CX4HX4C containing protein [Tanacetum coccineum]